MAKPIQILAGESQYLQGLYARPDEDSTEDIDQLLVIMVHGFPGNKSAHNDVFQGLASLIDDKNYHTLQFDFLGCGESDGREEDFTLKGASKDLETVLEWATDQGYTRFIFVGEGLGAPIALMNAPEQTLCYILLWPMIDLPRIAKSVFKADNIEDQWKKAGYAIIDEHRVGLNFIKELENTDIAPALKDLNRPLLIMHGAQDPVSPIEQIDIVRKNARARRVEITSFQDGGHGLTKINHRKMMYYHIMQFIEKYT